MIGIEILRDRHSQEKAPDLRDQLVQMAFERGLLVLGAGENTLRLSPPLIVTTKQAGFACGVLEQCLEELHRTLRRTAA
jgi:4-aminobutyrate aminotransferase